MRKLILLTLLTTSLLGCSGCFGSGSATIIDYSTKPQDFIMRFELNKKYLIKRQGEEFTFQVTTGFFNADKITITWDKLQEERSSLRVSQRVPYLIYVDGQDFIYLYEESTGTAALFDLNGKNAKAVEKIIKDEKIRDAVAFQEESSDANNHFVKLIINGQSREFKGTGSGANPRTAIGQRADGTVLLLVTDGRGANGHLGATAADLIDIMEEYGAVNAANIDGGSSSSMYYDGKFEMTSVTLYYSNSSWRLPTGFIVEKR